MRYPLALSLLLLSGAACAAEKVVLVAGGGDGADGTEATQAKLVQPFAVDFDIHSGDLYFAEMAGGERIRKIDKKGIITTYAGTGKKGPTATPKAGLDKAEFNGMHNLIVDNGKIKFESIWVADTFNHCIRQSLNTSKEIWTIAGSGKKGFSGDGDEPNKAEFDQPICIAMNPAFTKMYVADIGNKRVRLIDLPSNKIGTFAGNGKSGVPKDGEPAAEQPLVDPRAVAVDGYNHRVYILERSGHALRVVEKDGKIRTVAGTGKAGSRGADGPALKAEFNGPKFIHYDHDTESILIADTENHRILRYIPKTGMMELVAGTGKKGSGGVGGDPKKLEMGRPHGVSAHPKTGEIYIADSDNNRILKIAKE